MSRHNFVKYFAVSLLLLGACTREVSKEGMSPEELYTDGYKAFQETDYEEAADYFDEIEKQHPYSIWAERAQIMAAYSYYRQNEYDKAILTLDRFIQLHPGNRNTPYAYYLKGLSYFEQMSDAKREQSMTQQAQQTFNEMLARYPHSVYAADARVKMDEITNNLAAQDMNIGRYYLKHEDIIPAINRFKHVIEAYPKSNQVSEAYYRLVTGYIMLNLPKAAQKTAAVQKKKYPESHWTEKTAKLLEEYQ